MKVLRFFCNFLLFLAVMIGVSFVQIGIYDISAAQSKDVEGVHIAASTEDKIAYFDSYTFWATDISTSFKQPAKYRIRNWGRANWWKNGMEWADKGLDLIIASIKPIVVPIAQINAVKNYRGKSINDFDKDYFLKIVYDNEENYNNALYELYVIYNQGYGEAYTCGENPVPISEYEYTGEVDPTLNSENDYARWLVSHKQLYNTTWKLNKYNEPSYEKYYKKFIKETEGVRNIKTGAVILYYQQYVSIILAIFFISKYPIGMVQARYAGKKGERIL